MPETPTYQFTPSFSLGRGLERPSPVYQEGFLSPARPQARFPCILIDRAFKWIIYSPLFSTPIQNHQIDGDQNVSFLLQKSKLAFAAVVVTNGPVNALSHASPSLLPHVDFGTVHMREKAGLQSKHSYPELLPHPRQGQREKKSRW